MHSPTTPRISALPSFRPTPWQSWRTEPDRTAIGRSLCALLNLVLFLALPGTFYFFIGLMPSSKLYMNTMLATLNTRQHIRTKTSGFSGASGGNSSDQATMPMPVSMGGGMSLGGMGGMGGMRQDYELPVHIHRQVEFSRDDSDVSVIFCAKLEPWVRVRGMGTMY